ncbi:hypothetical protein BGZ54_002043 [Gamsiella multidivaricata]|nr:hypothetical protein BGZ54_002043 [Gamsiella multidivaricata]
MSPNPPMTPSITSNSNGSTLTALNSPQNSERGGPGAHLQKSIHVLPSSPPASSHYRKKSFNSGLIPHTLSSERSPMPSQAGSPISTPYGSPPKVASNYMNMLAARKNSLSENPSFNPRDLYRRSESYSALQARAIMNHSNASADLNGTILSSSQTSSRDHTMRPHESLEYDEYNLDAQMAGNHVEIRNEVWREQDQQPPQSHYHRNRSNREKHKRESFYAALQSSDQGAGSNHYDESRKPSKGSSRISSPYNSSGAPQTSTRTKGSIPTTPTAEHKTRPTPPPRSRSRTPAGNTGGNGSQTSLNAPQQPQMPRQYSGEIQPISRKSGMMVDDAMVSFVQRPDTQYSSSSSTPSNQSVEYQPRAGDGVPVPVADITKHLSVLEFKEQNAMAAVPPSDISTPNVHVRKPASSGMVGPHRRSIVFDGVGSSGRSNGTDGGHRLKDGLKERNSMIAGMSLGSSRKRGKTLSAMDPPKAKPAPAILPPMYMSTTSRTNVPSPMATRMAGSKIPSPYGGRKGTATPRDAASASNSRLLAVDATSGVVTQDVKTIRGGGEPETASSRIISSALSSIPGTESSNFASSGSGGMPKVKPNRSLSSGILGGLSRRRSAAMEHQMTTEPVPAMNEFVMQKQISSAKSSQTPPSTRLPNNTSHLLGPSEPKKTTATGLRTPTAVKELRTSPSKPQPKNPAVMSNPINIYASNQPMPLYGQGQASSVPQATHPGMEPRASGSTSGVSPYPPLSPYAALKMYAPYLSLYERAEIGEYPQIYYVGQNCRHKRAASMEASNSNFGFDDERGDYLIINHDHLMFRYEVLDMLGKGSFGQVAKCYDHKTGEYVAIKIIRNKKRFHCQALVEVKILSNLTKWDPEDKHNLIRMTDNFYFRNHLCIATELLSINLYEFIKSNSFQGVSLGLIKRFCTQLLQSLELLNRHNVVHCDLKPENVLLKHPTKSSIKVIDFGSSCLENEKVYTYIQSRFYRSPEVILGMSYNMAIDMWSLGCILAELYTGYPLFPGENEQEQLNCIMEVQGVPDRYIIERCSRRKVFFDSNGNPKLVVNSKGKKRRPGSKTLGQMLKCTDLLFLDFISKCLIWDPEQRMTPHEGLQHEWVSDKGSNKAAFSPVPSDSSGSRRKSSMHSSHSSRKAKSELESKLGLMNSSQTSLKSTRTTASNSNNGSFTYYSGSVPSFGNGSNGTGSNTNNVVKIYGGQQQYQHQPQFQQPQPYMGIYGSSVTSLNSSTSTLSSAASRRMTAGDLGPPAYQHGSRKNATSMYLAGPGGGGVGSHGMD